MPHAGDRNPHDTDDLTTTGTLAELQALLRRRLAEVDGHDSAELAGPLFRYCREVGRLADAVRREHLAAGRSEAVAERLSCDAESRWDAPLAERLAELLGEGWRDDATEGSVAEVLGDAEAGGFAAGAARPWTLRDRTTYLVDLLAEDDSEPVYRIDQLWPSSGKVILSAPQKSGKSTAVGNILRALVDGTPLFGPPDDGTVPIGGRAPGGFAVSPLRPGGTVFLADFELPRATLRRWLREQGIRHGQRIHSETFRGRSWDVRDKAVRAEWARHLRKQNTQVIVVDPLGPVLAALGINEQSNNGVGEFLQALDALVLESGASELLVIHHTGHSGERSRGASALRGWPDAEWHLNVKRPADGREPEPNAPRFFSAMGRDVAVPEQALTFHAPTRHLSVTAGNRDSYTAPSHVIAVRAIVEGEPGLTKNAVETKLRDREGMGQTSAREVIRRVIAAGEVHTHPGPNRGTLHFPGRSCGSCTAAATA